MRTTPSTPLCALLLLLTACVGTPSGGEIEPPVGADVGLDLGHHHRELTAATPKARRAVERGLTLAYAFNHDEAIAAFQEATELDPECPLAWWGLAHCNGPHINNAEVPPARAQAGYEAAQRALTLVSKAKPVEKALIEAQAARFAADPSAPRRPLDEAYAKAMAAAWWAHPDPDVGALYAEAMMDLQPWDLWTPDGKPKGAATQVVETLTRVLELQPTNPLANHLLIHALEASPNPERALPAADRLRALVPDAGHLVHMPAHIDIRVGAYERAMESNRQAIAADARTTAKRDIPKAGFYRLYMLHDHHFLAFAAMLAGRRQEALEAARNMVRGVPAEFIRDAGPLVDGYLPVAYHVLVRFGRWEEILDEPAYPPELAVSSAVRHYARGVALAALGRPDEAERELDALRTIAEGIDGRAVGNNPAKLVLQVPVAALTGEIAFRRGKLDEAVTSLREAVKVEDQLLYDEPPDWMMTPRHPLAAILISAGRWPEAEEVLQADLRRFPENGWALQGLLRCARGRGDEAAAKALEERFQKAWAGADTEIDTPCLCVTGTKK